MKKIGYILAAIYAVFSLSVSSFAFSAYDGVIVPLMDAGETSETEEDEPEAAESSDTEEDEVDPPAADTSDTEADDPIGGLTSDTEADDPTDTQPDVTSADDPAGSSVTTPDDAKADSDVTTANPNNVANSGDTNRNPATGVVLGFTALGLAAAGLTAGLAHKRK